MIVRKYMTAATVSWIDPATGLPEVDTQPVVSPTVNRAFLVGSQGFRFTNFVEAFADIDQRAKRIVGSGFTVQSGMYRGPSYLRIPSHAFFVDQRASQPAIFREGAERVTLTQTVGARTVSPEMLGGVGGAVAGAAAGAAAGTFVFPAIGTAIGALAGAAIGAISGEIVGHQVIGFPPIWTTIEVEIPFEGPAVARLLYHSLFPSMTFYVQPGEAPPPGLSRTAPPVAAAASAPFAGPLEIAPVNGAGATYYNATKDVELPAWQERGWGKLNRGGSGPTAGNPWSIEKGVMGAASSCPN